MGEYEPNKCKLQQKSNNYIGLHLFIKNEQYSLSVE